MIREYHAPATVEEAIALKERFGEAAVYLAGGTEVSSTAFRLSPEHVISLQKLALASIRLTDSELILGAGCTIQQIIDFPDVPPGLKAAGRHVCNRNIRNMATIGGQFGSNRSCSNLLPVLVALEAAADVAGRGAAHAIPALEYIVEERKDLITQIRVGRSALTRSVAVEKYSRTANDLSIITVAVSLTRDGTSVTRPIIAAGGLDRHVIRLDPVERELDGKPLPRREAIERMAASHIAPITDIRGSAEFKRHLAGVLIAKALGRAYRPEEGAQ